MRNLYTLLLLLCLSSISFAQTASSRIHLNQIGFFPEAQKLAVVNSDNDFFEIVTSDNLIQVFQDTLSEGQYWDNSNETVRIADFSEFKNTGTFRLKSGTEYSHPFTIGNDVLKDLTIASIKAYYFNRASTALSETFAGEFARPLGHADDQVVVHPSAASTSRPAGTIISTPKGWYDAGDYNKYIVNSGISMFTLLSAYENFPEYYNTLATNIPEGTNSMPDLLDEVLWNLEWMLTMQDQEDGGVYNKTTTANFQGIIMPHEATATRYVVAKGTAATLDFAAVMAMAARIYQPYLPDLATECLEKAELAWSWAKANPNVAFNNPGPEQGYPGVSTGGYGDGNFTDEFFWAASELYITTEETKYYDELNFSQNFDLPGWPNVQMLGIVSLITNDKADTSIENILLNYANNQVNYQKNSSPYKIPNNQFYWGSNSIPANQGMLLMTAYNLTKNVDYYNAALSALDYLLGRNATAYCFVTGFGGHSPQNIHHRQSAADNVDAPVPGFLAGGPNPNDNYDCGAENYPSKDPAKCYHDDWCSYSTNEVTINWNAPLVFLSGALQHVYNTDFKGPDHGKPDLPLQISDNMEFEIVPNPAHNHIEVKNADVSGLQLFSLSGKELLYADSSTMELTGIPKGVYLLCIKTPAGKSIRKIIKK